MSAKLLSPRPDGPKTTPTLYSAFASGAGAEEPPEAAPEPEAALPPPASKSLVPPQAARENTMASDKRTAKNRFIFFPPSFLILW